jgi:hypothetical protein
MEIGSKLQRGGIKGSHPLEFVSSSGKIVIVKG